MFFFLISSKVFLGKEVISSIIFNDDNTTWVTEQEILSLKILDYLDNISIN